VTIVDAKYAGYQVMGDTKRPDLTGFLQPDSAGPELMDDAALEVFEIAGMIKWFDASKGYGFIVPDNGLPDILLHVTCLRAGGFQTAYEGARVHCEVLRRPKGIQASAFSAWTRARPFTPRSFRSVRTSSYSPKATGRGPTSSGSIGFAASAS
jgi:cold shock CspA family protein